MNAVTYFANKEIIEITSSLVQEVKGAAQQAPLRRARLCLHCNPGDRLHEMVIAFCRDSYVRPHRHHDKTESFHIIEGKLDVIFFDDTGRVTRSISMGTVDSGLTFFYRLASAAWHTVLVRTEMAVIHETTNGPFVPQESEFAGWSPDPCDQAGVAGFFHKLLENTNEPKS